MHVGRSDKPQHVAQIAPWIRVSVEIKVAVRELVPVPRDVHIDRVDAECTQARDRGRPKFVRQPLVKKRRAV